ncbi:MAG: hypothetical protein G01um101416_862 [Microgenomates group bacterium Gr01-1014_16]|nr:MAG: hypothetical protein G01um101416_862 [Microgenomates group bacterium Gr01-1014_16]
MNFPYVKLPGLSKRPLIETYFRYKNTSLKNPVLCLVDSGADISYFDMDLASELGLDVPKLRQVDSWDISGNRFWGGVSNIVVIIGGHEFEIPAIFSDQIIRSFCVLGQEGLFDQARVIFERYKWNLDIRPVR